ARDAHSSGPCMRPLGDTELALVMRGPPGTCSIRTEGPDFEAPDREETRPMPHLSPAYPGAPPIATLLTPECNAEARRVPGDQYTMVHCRGCGAWCCPEHITAAAGVSRVRLPDRTLRGLASS